MNRIEGAILSSFRAGIVAIRSDGTMAYINPIGAKILEGCSLREGENIHPRAAENVFFRVLSEALSMNYLPTRVEAELPGRDGERQSLGFTLSVLKEGWPGRDLRFLQRPDPRGDDRGEREPEAAAAHARADGGGAGPRDPAIRSPASVFTRAFFVPICPETRKLLSSVGMMSREIGRSNPSSGNA